MKLQDMCRRSRSFLGSSDSYESAGIVLVGIPMDITSSFRPGSRQGPQAIRDASEGLEEYSPYLDRELKECPFYDGGDLALPFGNVEMCLQKIEEITCLLLEDRKTPFFLGGEHLISYPVVKTLCRYYPGLVVLQFDAHADLRHEYLGEIYSHATVLRRICEVVGNNNVFQFGIRSGTKEEFSYGRSYTNFYPFELSTALDSCIPLLKERPVYVTLDIDVIDPGYAPGTGTPEPGGATPQELFRVIALLKELQVVGCDLVEVAPTYDPGGITSLLAAKLVREEMLAFSSRFVSSEKHCL